MDHEKAAQEPLTGDDPTSKVKFTSGGGNSAVDAKIDISRGSETKRIGMLKEELMKYADDPFWVRIRTTLFVLFWLLWFSMFIGAIVIILMTHQCTSSMASVNGTISDNSTQFSTDLFINMSTPLMAALAS